MAIDGSGIYTYSESDTISSWPAFMNLGMSSVKNTLTSLRNQVIYTVLNYSDMNNKKNALASQGVSGSASAPIGFFRVDTGTLFTWNGNKFTEIKPSNNDTDPNVLVIGGNSYQRTGITPVSDSTAFTPYSGVFAKTISVTRPYTPPDGYNFSYRTGATKSYTAVTNANITTTSSSQIDLRVIQFGSNAPSALTHVIWELVKI